MKQVIVLRKDLNMRKGKAIAQGAHASLQAVLSNLKSDDVKEWLNTGMTKIAVSVDSEEQLLEIYNKAKVAGLLCSVIRDAGKTEFSGVPTLTAVAIGPGDNNKIDNITGSLSLL